MGADQQWISLQGELRSADEQEILLQASSQVFIVEPGFFQAGRGQLATKSSRRIADAEVLQSGTYQLCVYAIDAKTQSQLWQGCQMIHLAKDQSLTSQGTHQPIQWSGFSRVEAQWSSQQRLFQQSPASYVRYQVSPQFQVYGIPFGAYAYVTTEHQAPTYQLNHMQLRFNAADLQTLLRQKAEEKLAAAELAEHIGRADSSGFIRKVRLLNTEAYTQELRELKASYGLDSTQTIESYLNQMKELERLEQSLGLPIFDDLKKGKPAWKRLYEAKSADQIQRLKDSLGKSDIKEYEALLRWESLYMQREKLLAKKAELEKLKQRTQQLENLKTDWTRLQTSKQGQLGKLLDNPQNLKELGLANRSQQLLSQVQQLGLGNVFPYFDPLTIDGVQVQGVNITVTPRSQYYSQLVAGRMRQPHILSDSLSGQKSSSTVLGIKTGLGDPQGNHIHLSFLNIQDQEKLSIPRPQNRSNILYGLNGGLQLAKGKVFLTGALMHSQLTVANPTNPSTLKWQLQDSLDLAGEGNDLSNTSSGWAWRITVDASLLKGKSRIYGHYLQTPPTYQSLAAPMLIADRERYEMRWTQRLWKNKVMATAYYRQDLDNLLRQKWAPTIVRSGGFQVGIYPGSQWPSVQLNYAPLYQQQQAIDTIPSRETYRGYWSLSSNYGYKIGSVQMMYALQVSYQQGHQQDSLSAYDVKGGSLQQLIQFHPGLRFQVLGSYYLNTYSERTLRTLSTDASILVRVKRKAEIRLGGQWLEEKAVQTRSRWGIYLQGSVPIAGRFVADLRMERNLFQGFEDLYLNPQEFLARIGVSYQW